ncbi:MAG TPA: hypothetical protein VFP72_06220 [Kineosporiaceae bacterium]|nr:hypothetical protein [Kineosporiaceae bacterium]
MTIPLAVVWVGCATLSALLGLVNLIQVPLGRQVFAASRSRRTATQIRRQSLAAAIEMLGFSVACLGLLLGSGVISELGLVFAIGGFAALIVVRRSGAPPSSS